jgi:molybdate transport system permease protein
MRHPRFIGFISHLQQKRKNAPALQPNHDTLWTRPYRSFRQSALTASHDGPVTINSLPADSWAVISLSLQISLIAVAASMPLAFMLAWILARWRFPGKLLLDAVVHLPLVVPPVVTGWLLLVLFGANGPVGHWLEARFGISLLFRWTGAALAAAIMALPLMVRAIRLSIEAIDIRLEQAAQTLGAGRARIFATISLPLAAPGIVAAAILGFARSLGEFGATITFVSDVPGETRTLPIAIYAALQVPGGESSAAWFAILSILLSLVALILSNLLARRMAQGRIGHVV